MRSLLLLFLALAGTCGRAQIIVTGTVSSQEDATLLTGAYVYPKATPGLVTVTDTEGAFSLKLPAPDTIIISYLGFQELRRFVAKSEELHLTLLATDAASMDAVTVRAKKILHGELASERISQLQIYLNPAAKADPLLAVNSLPAATNVDETANVSLRGSPSAATGIYLNDVPIRNAVRLDQSNGVGQFSIFGQIPLRDVRIYSSHPPVSFSQTSAGAVGLYTSAELPAFRQHGLSVHMAGIGLSHARPLGEKSGIRAFVNYGNLSAFRAANQQGLPELKRSRSLDAAVQFVHQFSSKSSFQLFYLGFQESYRFLTRTPYYTGDFEQRKPRHLAVFNWRIERERWTWKFNQSIDWEKAEFTLGNILTNPRRLTGHAAAHGRYQGPGFSLQIGSTFNGYDDRTEGRFPLSDYDLAPEAPSGTYLTETAHQLLEGYAYAQFRLGDKWLVGAGIKPIRQLNINDLRYTAQASLRFRPGARHKFNLGGGHFSQYLPPGPDFREWQWLELRQIALEYAYQHRGWKVEAAAYAKQENYGFSPDLRVKGGELRVGLEEDSWLAWVSGALASSRSVDGHIPTRRDLPFLARAQVQKQFLGQWTVGIAATYRRGTYFLPVIGRTPLTEREGWFAPVIAAPENGQRYPNYQRVDLSLSKVLPLGDGQVILYLNINNLLNAENIRSYSYDATYLERGNELFSRRLIFVGGVWQW